ncbi:MAG: tetratricopeptide repeat protein [Chloroflexi bacterium]|nr:tetratricopeptide repeat protein [Chloroflexota bacterium]
MARETIGMENDYELARALLEKGHVAQARTVLEQILNVDPTHLNATFGMGVCEHRSGQYVKAERLLRDVVKRAPRQYKAAYYLGLTLEGQGRTEEAVVALRHALRVKPNFSEAMAKLRQLQSKSGPAPHVALGDKLDGPEGTPLAPPFEGTSPSGALLFEGKRSSKTFAVPIVLLSLLVVFWLIVSFLLRNPRPLFVGVILAAATFALVVLLANSTRLRIYERRVEYQTGMLLRKVRSIWLYEVLDCEYSRGLWLLLVNSGKVTVKSQQNNNFHLVGFGDADFMRKLWDELRDSVLVERRSMKKWWI